MTILFGNMEVITTEKQVYFTVDSDELISLRDFGYLSDDELEDAEAITNALHTVISDLCKMKVETENQRNQKYT